MYDDTDNPNIEPEQEVDPRIVAMHRVVDLERQHERAARESEERQKMAAIVGNELGEARTYLADLLGYPSDRGAKQMDRETLKRELSKRDY